MTPAEATSWAEFYRLFPFDDVHRFHRPAAMIGASMAGELDKRLDWLAPPPEIASGALSEADLNTMKAFGRKPGAR